MILKGYSIVELLGVISTIGIMASVSIPSYMSMQTNAKITKAEAEIKLLQTMVEKYQTQYGQFPQDLNMLNFDQKINVTNSLIKDPFFSEKEHYALNFGKTAKNSDYYVIYTKGENGIVDFEIKNDKIYNKGDDVIVSNLMIVD